MRRSRQQALSGRQSESSMWFTPEDFCTSKIRKMGTRELSLRRLRSGTGLIFSIASKL